MLRQDLAVSTPNIIKTFRAIFLKLLEVKSLGNQNFKDSLKVIISRLNHPECVHNILYPIFVKLLSLEDDENVVELVSFCPASIFRT